MFRLPASTARGAASVLPIGPSWVLQSIGLLSLFTTSLRRGDGSRSARGSTVLRSPLPQPLVSRAGRAGIAHRAIADGFTLCLWFSINPVTGRFWAHPSAHLRARFGRLSLSDYHGLYEHTYGRRQVCFLLTGLACVGIPGTLGFISIELLVDSAVEASPYVGIVVIAAGTLNGIAVMRAYFLLFTGARHVSTVSLGIGLRERAAVLSLSVLILGGGLFPQLGVATRQRAAEEILQNRRKRLHLENPARRDETVLAPVKRAMICAQRSLTF